ncbi:uncharacterized protein LOC130500031 [Raphanus sativus]|uniref:Uncharacterized protein LOC130500031 n=1 Tax=Raphanus sativus TaxID=3726 RepID=A0A9W3CGK6_RAPSA|nr:uncharacterized protein LOC130500031 [Raphanus sativus]
MLERLRMSMFSPQFRSPLLRRLIRIMRQMIQESVQQIAQEAARQAAQEAARVAAQEVARQMAAAQQVPQGPQIHVQQGPQIHMQQVPLVQVQHDHQVPAQQAPAPQYPQVPIQPVPGVFHVPPPPPVIPVHVPEVDETFIRVLSQMKYVNLEHFSGTTDPTLAHDWRHSLDKCLNTISCPPRHKLRIAELYLRGDAAVWWDGVRVMHRGEMTFDDFMYAFNKKYFPREALDEKKNDFESLRQGGKSVREYEHEFRQLHRFAGNGMDEEDLIRRFLKGMRVELRGRCSMATYTSLEDLVEKTVVQEKCMAEEQKYSRAVQPKSGGSSSSQKRTWEQTGTPRCGRCRRHHFGECFQCSNCGLLGHLLRDCWRPPRAQVGAPTAPVAANRNCYGCNQPGHIFRDCPRRGNAALPPPPKRLAIAPRVFTVGEAEGAEPIAGLVSVGGEPAHTLFDTGASHSFVTPRFAKCWSFRGVFVQKAKQIQTAGSEKLGAIGIHHDVPVTLGGVEFLGDLTEMELSFYDVILGMDWLSRHRVVLDCPDARVNIPRAEGNIVFQGTRAHQGISIVSMLRAEELLENGAEGFLATISMDKDDDQLELQDIPVVAEYADVFEALKGPPPARSDVLAIEVEPGAAPVSRAPYRLAPAEMAELKKQLEELSDKGFIRPSTSPWGAPVLFVKKKMEVSGFVSTTEV